MFYYCFIWRIPYKFHGVIAIGEFPKRLYDLPFLALSSRKMSGELTLDAGNSVKLRIARPLIGRSGMCFGLMSVQ